MHPQQYVNPASMLPFSCNPSLFIVTGRKLHFKAFTVIDRIDNHPHAIIKSCLGNAMGYFNIMHRASRKVSKGNSKLFLFRNLSIGTILEVLTLTGKMGWLRGQVELKRRHKKADRDRNAGLLCAFC
jgi:hypothetical protein